MIHNATQRQPMLMLVCGETGVGKSYRNKQEINKYLQTNPTTGKQGRKVLAFDTNDDDYPEFKTVSPKYIKALKSIAPRRIRPFEKSGIPMDDNQKKKVVDTIMRDFTNGMIVLDDIDNYMSGAKGQAMIGALCTVRHKGVDVLLTHQSVARIATVEWENCTYLRLHHQVDDVTRYKSRIPKYQLVRIAQLIIDDNYEQATRAYMTGQLSEPQYNIQKSFFVYVNMRQHKISGCSREAFIRACKRFIDQEENKKVRMLMSERDFKGKLKYKDRNAAVIKLICDYTRFHDTRRK